MLSRLLFLGIAMLFSWSLQAQFPCLSGEISLYPGQTASFCDAGNGDPVFIRFRARPSGVPRAYVVVNGEDEIVYIGYGSTINFTGLGSGLRVYSFTLVGSITAEIGDNINDTQLASGCSELSSNFIEIMMDNGGQEGGTLSGGPFAFCVGDGTSDFIPEGAISLSGEVAENTAWIVTDAGGTILGLPPSPYVVDFDGAGVGTCNIYHVSYLDGLQGLEADANIGDLMGCFDLSNPIEVIRTEADGGTLEGGPFSFCVGDGLADLIGEDEIILSGNSGPNNQWIVTDANGNILGLPPTYSVVDFDGAGAGTCFVYHLSYNDGIEGLVTDANINDLVGCFDLSNGIAVNRSETTASSLTGGPFDFCVGDFEPDLIPEGAITLVEGTGDNASWVITDADGTILGLPLSPYVVNFDFAGGGSCLIYRINYANGLAGLMEDANLNNLDGCFSLSNAVTVNRTEPDGGVILGGPYRFCVDNGVADMIPDGAITIVGGAGENFFWIVTDVDDNIIGLPPSPYVVDFDGAGEGTCYLRRVATFSDEIPGLTLGTNLDDLGGCFNLSNRVTVIRTASNGGVLAGGPFTFCVGDGIADMIAEDEITLSGNTGTNTQWVITDANGNILGLPPTFSVVDFDDAGAGTCLVYHLSYEDGLEGLVVDANIADLTGCFGLSNAIIVNRGENTASSLVGGPFDFCVGNFEPDFIPEGAITLIEGSGDNASWLITDADGTILGLPPSPYVVNFDFAGGGTCLIYHINYVTGLAGLTEGANIADLDGCFLLSNALTVNRTDPDAGVILGGPYTFCVGDGSPDMLNESDINIVGGAVENVFWIVTDTEDNIIGTPPSFTDVDFDGAGAGTCYIRRVTGTFDDGVPGLEVGTNLDDLQGCFALSNRVTIIRKQPEGGLLEGGPFSFCVSDNIPDMIEADAITLSGNNGSNAQWVITDADGTILGLPPVPSAVDFDGAGEGTCLIYHLSYEDGLEGLEGELNIADLAGCFALSNAISVERTAINGGAVTTIDGETSVDVTVNDGIDDIIQFMSTNAIGENFTYIITDANNEVLSIPEGDTANFEGAGVGVCRVWGLAYTGELLLQVGDIVGQVAPSEGCFAISDIFITVNRTEGLQPNLPGNRSRLTSTIDVQLYPNPAIDQLQVKLTKQQASSMESSVTLQLMQLDGKIVYHNTLGVGQMLSTIDIAQLPAGTYFIRINDGKQMITKRFVKVN